MANGDEVYIVHRHPLVIERQNYIEQVDLSPYGLPDQFEQLWLRPADDGVFELSCIPFCVYGLAFLDLVTVTSDGRFVDTIVKKSGRRVLRVLLMESLGADLAAVVDSINDELLRADLRSE